MRAPWRCAVPVNNSGAGVLETAMAAGSVEVAIAGKVAALRGK